MNSDPSPNTNLVEEIMQNLEQSNGSFDEDTGKFKNTKPSSSNQPTDVRQQIMQIIQTNDQLKNLLSVDPKARETLNGALNHDKFVSEIIQEDPETIPAIILSILQSSQSPELESQHSNQSDNIHDNFKPELNALDNYSTNYNENGKDIPQFNVIVNNMYEPLIGALITVVSYLILKSGIFDHLSLLPYIGSYLWQFKEITSVILLAVTYIILSFLINWVIN